MAESKQPDETDDYLTVNELMQMFTDEIRNVNKAAELRIREYATLVKEYAAGELTPEQAHDRLSHHIQKWGEPVPGTYSVLGKSDEEILAAVEESAGPFTSRAEIEQLHQKSLSLRGRPTRERS